MRPWIVVNQNAPTWTQMSLVIGGADPPNLFEVTANFTVHGVPAGLVVGRAVGHIVQHVRRTEKKYNDHGQTVLLATNQYWEAWDVDAVGNVIVPREAANLGFHDRFTVGNAHYTLNRNEGRGVIRGVTIASKQGTKGKWKIMGKLYWVYATDFDWVPWQDDVPEAGYCQARWNRPTIGNGLRNRALGRCHRTRTWSGEWDNTVPPGGGPRRNFSGARSRSHGWGFSHMGTALGTTNV